MNLKQFIWQNAIQPADAIIMKKKLFGMVDHYVIYMGMHNTQPLFVANYTKGVKVIPNHELKNFLEILEPTKIERFTGSERERQKAVSRAQSRIGERAYDYLTNNCEHFKNWVHKGVHKSEQVENFGKGAATVLGTVAVLGLLSAIFKDD